MTRHTTIGLLIAGLMVVSGCGLFEETSGGGGSEPDGQDSEGGGEAEVACEYPGATSTSMPYEDDDGFQIEGALRAHKTNACRVESDAEWRHFLTDLPSVTCGFHARSDAPEPQDAVSAVEVGLRHWGTSINEEDIVAALGTDRESVNTAILQVLTDYARGTISPEEESIAWVLVPVVDVLRCSYGPSYVADLVQTDVDVFREHHAERLYERYLELTPEEAADLADEHALATEDESAAFTAAVQTRNGEGRRYTLVLAGNDEGIPETGLGGDDLVVHEGEATLDAAQLSVTSLGRFARQHPDQTPLSVALLHRDHAAAGGTDRTLDEDALVNFIELLPEGTTASVTSTRMGVTRHLEPTSSLEVLRRELSLLSELYNETKYDALDSIFEHSLDADARFQIVLDTSMGAGWDSRHQCYQSVVAEANERNIPIFGAAYGENSLGELSRMAEDTRGCMVWAPSPHAMRAELAELAVFLEQAYVVSWESDSTAPVWVDRRIDHGE